MLKKSFYKNMSLKCLKPEHESNQRKLRSIKDFTRQKSLTTVYILLCLMCNQEVFVYDFIVPHSSVHVCLGFVCGIDYRRHWGTDGYDAGGQQDNDENDDDHHHHNDHDQLDVLPPVGAGHFLRRLLEVLSLFRFRETRQKSSQFGQRSPKPVFVVVLGGRGVSFWSI